MLKLQGYVNALENNDPDTMHIVNSEYKTSAELAESVEVYCRSAHVNLQITKNGKAEERPKN